MDNEEFRENAHQAIDWVADYLRDIEKYPVKSQVKPGDIFSQIPDSAPSDPEEFDALVRDINEIILPGITHWQHPNFHAYFPGNSSYPSILGEIFTAGMAAQCMIWETSPAAAELEEKMMDWLKDAMGLPNDWHGVIQDTASTATLVAILSAREKITNYRTNQSGLSGKTLRVYCSEETHSSIDKAVKIAGIGSDNLIKIPVDESLAMIPSELDLAIQKDLKAGHIPCCIVATLGTTSTLAFDPLKEISQIAQQRNIWLHVDAAYAGSAFLLPEFRHLARGIELADSYVFNPHKWLMTNFDCSAYFVKSKEDLTQTFSIMPEYLKTGHAEQVNNYRDWGIQLGRRFRALKLWFVLRSFGIKGLQRILKDQIALGVWLKSQVENHPNFELLAPQVMNMVVFRYVDSNLWENQLDQINEKLLKKVNDSGKAYLTHTKIEGKFALRIVAGQLHTKEAHIEKSWNLILEIIKSINK